jgi:MFS transporter, SHS family, sialic acid transporter
MTLAAAFLGWMFDGFEMGLFPLVGRPALKDLLGKSGEAHVDVWFGLMIAGFLVGAASGGVLFGWLGDRLGRVRAMSLSVLTYAVFMGLCGLADSPTKVFVFRFISSLGMGGEWSLGVALVMEIWPDKSRGMLAGLIGAASNVGFLSIAFVGLVLGRFIETTQRLLLEIGLQKAWVDQLVAHSGWRLMMLVGALPALLTFFIQLLVPESRRWQHEKLQGTTSFWSARDLWAVVLGTLGPLGMIVLWLPETTYPLAVRIAGSAIGVGLAVVGFVFPVFRYLKRAGAASRGSTPNVGPTLRRMLLGACLSGVALVGTWASVQLAPSWAGKLVELRAEQQGTGATSPSVIAEGDSARSWTQILSGLGAIVGTMAGALLGTAIGRRLTYTILCLGSLVATLWFYLGNDAYGPMFLVCVLVLGGLTASFYGWLPLYLPELFPTRLRATGQGFSFNFGRIIAAVAALQTGPLMGLFGQNKVLSHAHACSTVSLVYLVGMAIIWMAPETYGRPLPE